MAYRVSNENTVCDDGENCARRIRATLQDVLDAVEVDMSVAPSARRDRLSALRTLAKKVGRPLASIPCETKVVRALVDGVAPARHNISAGRWANVRSLTFGCLKSYGANVRAGQCRTPSSPAWQRLLEPLPERQFRIPIRPFARWCTEQDIAPHQVTQADFEAYGIELEEVGTRSRPREAYCALIRAWNRAQVMSKDWPNIHVELDRRHNHYARPLTDFTPKFRADVQAMVEDALGRDPLSSSTRRPVRPVTAETRVNMIRAFASALVESGWAISGLRTIADIVTVEAAKAGLKFILARQDGRLTVHSHQHAKLLFTLAKHWVRVPDNHLAELARLRNRLRPQNQGMTAKNRATLRQFDDQRMVDRFLLLPEQLWRQYGTAASEKQSAAVKVQVALAVAILTDAPVRCRNLHAIRIGVHLVDVGAGRARRVHLCFPAGEVKNGVELEFPLRGETVRLLDRYVENVRPKLTRQTSNYLFPGQGSGPKGGALFSVQIADIVEGAIGVRLTAHQFRHLVGYIYLQANPGGHEVVRQLLGHKDIQTTLQFYAGMETQRAIDHYDAFLDSRRSGAMATPRRKRSRSAP